MSAFLESVSSQGFGIVSGVLPADQIDALLRNLTSSGLPRNRAGIRHALRHPSVNAAAHDRSLLNLAREVLGPNAIPIRATLFDKSPTSNWLVAWHQDTALPLRRRTDRHGWGPWSVKDGVTYANAPASALEQVLALRLHLDDSTSVNGPLRILPGTHDRGVLSDDQVHELSGEIAPADCLVPRGGVLAMRPLVVHASSKSKVPDPRRVLHIEYSRSLLIEDGMELAIA